jgi:hypothetical protein
MTAQRGARLRLRLAFVGVVLWFVAMVWMTLTTANPIVVSRLQVMSASAVVRGRLEPGTDSRLSIQEILWSRRPLTTEDFPKEGIVVVLQPQRWHAPGREVFAALEESSPGRFRIQPIPLARDDLPEGVDPAPIYPATSAVRKTLEELHPRKRKQ